MNMKELLNMKDFKYRSVITVCPHENLTSAIFKLVEHDRGAISVCDDKGELVGILTERDIVRKCLAHHLAPSNVKVQDVMTKEIMFASPQDDLNYAISVMKQRRIRHLPVVERRKVIGMISMRDLLGVELEECEFEVRNLSDYITGTPP